MMMILKPTCNDEDEEVSWWLYFIKQSPSSASVRTVYGLCCFLLPLLQYLWENFSNISGISAKPDFVNPDFWDLTIAKFWQFMGTKMLLCDHWPTSRTRVIKLSWTLTFTTTTKKNCKMAAAAWVNAKDEISRRRPLPPRCVLSCHVIMQGGGFLWRGPTNHFRSITCLQQISWLPSISDEIFFFSKYNHQ